MANLSDEEFKQFVAQIEASITTPQKTTSKFKRPKKKKRTRYLYETQQYADVLNGINNEEKSNVCLRAILLVNYYIDTQSYEFASQYLNLQRQPWDLPDEEYINMVKRNLKTQNLANRQLDLGFMKHLLFAVWKGLKDRDEPQTFCYLLINRTITRQKIVHSHVTLVCHNANKVYHYNSGLVSSEHEAFINSVINQFYSIFLSDPPEVYGRQLAENGINNRIILEDATKFCPILLQGSSTMCAIFVFHFYACFNRNRNEVMKQVIKRCRQRKRDVVSFYENLSRRYTPRGKVLKLPTPSPEEEQKSPLQ